MMTIMLLLLAGMFKAVMDTLQFHYGVSVFAEMNPLFWNPEISWKNKYKDGDPTKGEKFFLSKTALVGLTDAWHLSQTLFLTCLVVSIVFYEPIVSIIIDFIILKLALTGSFSLFYSKIFTKE